MLSKPFSDNITAKSFLLCTETILLNIKSVNITNPAASVELLNAINNIQVLLDKAKTLLKDKI